MYQNQLWNTPLDANDSEAKEELGILREEYDSTNGGFKVYKYVQAAADTTVANGTALGYTDVYGHVVTSDISDSVASYNAVGGVGIGVITAEYFGWVQVRGYHSAVKTNGDDDIAAGASLILSSTDGTVDSVAAGTAPTYKIVGIAVAADVDASNTVAAMLLIV